MYLPEVDAMVAAAGCLNVSLFNVVWFEHDAADKRDSKKYISNFQQNNFNYSENVLLKQKKTGLYKARWANNLKQNGSY